MNPRHPKTNVSPNRIADRYARVGLKRVLHIDPSTMPKTATPAAITARIRRSGDIRMRSRSPGALVINGYSTRWSWNADPYLENQDSTTEDVPYAYHGAMQITPIRGPFFISVVVPPGRIDKSSSREIDSNPLFAKQLIGFSPVFKISNGIALLGWT